MEHGPGMHGGVVGLIILGSAIVVGLGLLIARLRRRRNPSDQPAERKRYPEE